MRIYTVDVATTPTPSLTLVCATTTGTVAMRVSPAGHDDFLAALAGILSSSMEPSTIVAAMKHLLPATPFSHDVVGQLDEQLTAQVARGV
jgi:hypothetical protein